MLITPYHVFIVHGFYQKRKKKHKMRENLGMNIQTFYWLNMNEYLVHIICVQYGTDCYQYGEWK